MKRFYFITLLALFCLNAKAQWNYYCYFDTYFNGGTWGYYGYFQDADFITKDTGIYSFGYQCSPSMSSPCHTNAVKKTCDGGNTWSSTLFGGDVYSSFTACAIRKQKTFYVVLNNYNYPSGYSTTLFKSPNGGLTWNSMYSNGNSSMSLPTGSDSSHFYFLRSHYLCKYKNGILDDSYLDVASMSPYELFFPDSIIGYMSASSSGKISLIFKTTDGGANWDTVYYSPLRNIGKMYFVDPNIGYALCDSGKMIKTINGGANWQNLSLGTTTKLHSVFFINDSVGFAAGDSGVIIRTTNGGQNWSKDITGITTSFTKIFFVSDSIGFALTGQTLYVTNLNWHTGIWEIYDNSKKQINIYPNPNEGKCDITVPNDFLQEKNLVLSIYDNTGRLIQQTKVEMNEDKIKLNLEAEAKGIYQVTLSDKTKTYSGKIIFE